MKMKWWWITFSENYRFWIRKCSNICKRWTKHLRILEDWNGDHHVDSADPVIPGSRFNNMKKKFFNNYIIYKFKNPFHLFKKLCLPAQIYFVLSFISITDLFYKIIVTHMYLCWFIYAKTKCNNKVLFFV